MKTQRPQNNQHPLGISAAAALVACSTALGLSVAVSSASLINDGSFDSGAITGLYNTGTTPAGGVLSNGAAASPYTLVSAPSPQGTSLSVYSSAGGYPGADWVPPGSYSAWIAPVADSAYTNSPQTYGLPGAYVFQTTFNSTSAGSITISGNWATDNSSNSMQINSDGAVSITPTSGFGAFSAFTITGNIIAGSNTFDFYVTNGTTLSHTDGANPTGLRVEFAGVNVVPLPVPAPGPLALIGGLALAGGLVLRRRMAQKA